MKRISCFVVALLVFCFSFINVCAANAQFTRGSFCQKIADTIQSRKPIIDSVAVDNPFYDLEEDNEYYEAMMWMNAVGYINGYEDGTLCPGKALTNAEAARVLTRMAFGNFSIPDDAEIDKRLEYHWAATYVWKAADSGLMPNIGYWNAENNVCENDIDYDALKKYMKFDEISIVTGGEKIEFSNSQGKPLLKNECVMAPMRSIAESLDLVASWDQATKTITLQSDEYLLELQLDSSIMRVNGSSVIIDESPCIVSGATYVPVRAIAEAIEIPVYWYPQINTMIIKNSQNVTEDVKDEFNAEANIVNGNVIITADVASINEKKNIHVAIYDIDNKMVEYIVVPSIYSNNTVNTVFKYSPEMFYAKVFIWEDIESIQPLVNALTLLLK